MSEDKAAEDLARSGLTVEDAERAGWAYTDNAKQVALSFERVPALVIGYYDPETGAPIQDNGRDFVRVRYLEEVRNRDDKVVRYSQPRGSGVHAYFPSGVRWSEVFKDPTWPIVITEGEKKAESAAKHLGVACIGLGGVWNWREKDDSLLTELQRVDWAGRTVVLAYDSDAATNPQVRLAELTLAAELQSRGADVRLCRLHAAADGSKRGLDDYIVAGESDSLLKDLERAEFIPTVDIEVMKLNEEIAYVEADDQILVLAENRRITKSSFVQGSRWSSMTVSVPRSNKGKVHTAEVPLAPLWLKHPSARRYSREIFDPSTNQRDVITEAGVCLNSWRGFKHSPGDVTPFLKLTEHLMANVQDDLKDLPLKLMAYKAQNPARKFALALVFLGKPGSGKSAWPKCIARAMAPYGVVVNSAALKGDFNEFLERSLFAVIDEAQAVHTHGARDVLKNIISEKTMRVNIKHRTAQQVDTYTQFALTANERSVGAFEADDRRMVVIGCPHPLPDAFYTDLFDWLDHRGGAEHLMHYLLTYDLKGWAPPLKAPQTAEKAIAYQESMTPVQRLASEMLDADGNVVRRWLDAAMAWAQSAQTNEIDAKTAKAVQAMAQSIQIRPFYTADELALMFPAIVGTLHGNKKLEGTPSGKISLELRNAGVAHLLSRDDTRGFMWQGQMRQYLVIAEPDRWREPLPQKEFERLMRSFETYKAPARGLQRTA